MNKRIVQIAPKSSMGKALSYLAKLSYAEEQRLRSAAFYLKSFLSFWIIRKFNRIRILSKTIFRPFVVSRKNWLFSGCPRGATASASFYSLIQNAKVTGQHFPTAYRFRYLPLGELHGFTFIFSTATFASGLATHRTKLYSFPRLKLEIICCFRSPVISAVLPSSR